MIERDEDPTAAPGVCCSVEAGLSCGLCIDVREPFERGVNLGTEARAAGLCCACDHPLIARAGVNVAAPDTGRASIS